MGYLNYSMARKVGLQTLKTWVLVKLLLLLEDVVGRNLHLAYSYYYEGYVTASYLTLHF